MCQGVDVRGLMFTGYHNAGAPVRLQIARDGGDFLVPSCRLRPTDAQRRG